LLIVSPRVINEVETIQKKGMIAKIPRVEDFLWPRPGSDWLDSLDLTEVPQIRESLLAFREQVRNWQGAVLLPVDQVILTLAQDLFTTPTDLAIAHKLAVLLRQAERAHPDWHLHELAGELAVIAKNERRFLGFSEDDSGFDPDAHPGEVVIATIHKAKGLEWDRVYLMSVNSYNFPAGEEADRYISEKWFLRDNLNLEAETLACGTGAAAVAWMAVQREWSSFPVLVHCVGGDLTIDFNEEGLTLFGGAEYIFTGEVEYGSRL
jgi:ATP-dependent exoDNAse (exonuclease V) beta subunit